LASIMAMLLAKSPFFLSREFSTWIAGDRPSGNTPSLTSWVMACWISWRMVSSWSSLSTAGAAAHHALVEKLGIIRCEDGLANLSRQLVDVW